MLKFVLVFLKENDIVTSDVLQLLEKHAEEIHSVQDFNEWLKLVKDKIGVQKYREIKASWANECKEDIVFKVKKPSLLQPKFVLVFLKENQIVTTDVLQHWEKHAEEVHSVKDVNEWLKFVKLKIGAQKYREMNASWVNECKKDCGFEVKDPSLLEQVMRDFSDLTK